MSEVAPQMTGKNELKVVCGFPSSVFRRPELVDPMISKGSAGSDCDEKTRLFLISDTASHTPVKGNEGAKKTSNRKYVTRSEVLIHNGKPYRINSKKSGIYTSMLHKLIEQLEICEDKWKRVFALRFDLHQEYYRADSKYISKFIDNLKRRLQREYEMLEIGYAWAREQERSKSQHYHFVLFLDGNKIRHSSRILEIIDSTWKNIQQTNHVPVIPKPYYFIDSPEKKEDAIYRISYLAKARGKGYRGKQNKDYSTSRLIARRTK